jgi:ureidoglycolate lyase
LLELNKEFQGVQMKKIELVPIESMSVDFQSYGVCVSVDNRQPDYDSPEFKFWNKLGIIESQNKCSICMVESYPQKQSLSTVFECHTRTGETLIPVENDVLLVLGLSKNSQHNEMDYDSVKAFLVRKGTAVILNPGTWHYAPIAQHEMVHTFVVFDHATPDSDVIKIDSQDAGVGWEIAN